MNRLFSTRTALGMGLAALLSTSALGSAQAAVTCTPMKPGEVYTGFLTMPGRINPANGTCWVDNITVTTHDGFKLTANVFLPRIDSPTQTFPTIVMVNSWVMPEWEYIGQAHKLAQAGYIVYEYASRGWWQSEGITRVASPDDIRDVSTIIDWLGANVPMDGDNIAISGISYGAGISLLALGREPRLKTAVALSGWANLEDQLFFQETTNKSNLNLLVGVAPLAGRLDPEVRQLQADLLNPDTTEARANEIRAWARPRSPITEVARINARQAPVFFSKNYADEMFTPNSTLAMFSQLTGPKKLLLNKGWHATAELPGALGAANHPYDQARRWFDFWLKGIDTGIMSEPQVDMAIGNDSGRERLATWPDATVKAGKLHLVPRGDVRFELGCLCTKGLRGGLQSAVNTTAGTDTINDQLDTVATTGIPLVSELLSGVGFFPMAAPALVQRANGVVYKGPVLDKALKVRGIPRLKLSVKPVTNRAQVMAYLYDVDAFGVGTLITHGARSQHWGQAGVAVDFDIELHMMSYNVARGHHLELVLDAKDPHYAPASNGTVTMSFLFSAAKESSLMVPYID